MYQNQFYQYPQYQTPRRFEITHVHGEPGIDALQMAPNCEGLFLDDTAPLVWLVQTDGAGYKTKTPFEIKPYEAPKPVDMNDLLSRIQRLEGMVNESNKPTAPAAE